MAATNITIEASSVNGKPLEEIQRLIALRQRALRETTGQAVIATAINILTSVRASTKVVDPQKASGFVTVAVSPFYDAGFKGVKGKQNGVRCLRAKGGGAHADGVKFVNLAGPYKRGETVKAYLVTDRTGTSTGATEQRYHIIANTLDEAQAEAAKRRLKRIERYAGMAKWLIGQAQSYISSGSSSAAAKLSLAGQKAALSALKVAVNDTGISNGSCSVEFQDNLNYAALALKNGMKDFEDAIKKAANKTAGIIQREIAELRFDELPRVDSPFPEVQRR